MEHSLKIKQEVKPRKRSPVFEETYDETSYYQENGMRKVYPYPYIYKVACKQRWIGKTVSDVFQKEFRNYPPKEYARIINAGAVKVNNKIINSNYTLQPMDSIVSLIHRHEAAVINLPIEVLHECDNLLVVNKPSSIPVHPCGRYRYNTISFILAQEFALKNLKPLHRLDRPTSGVLLFAKNKDTVWKFINEMSQKRVSKEYISRVVGEFPTGVVSCEEPIENLSHKYGIYKVGRNGKRSRTEFERISYDGQTSVVLCKPKTGRTHQIRVHLQYLGYPIVNDSIYNHIAFGPEKGKGGKFGKTNEQIVADLIPHFNIENYNDANNTKQEMAKNHACHNLTVNLARNSISLSGYSNELPPFNIAKLKPDPNCSDCRVLRPQPKPDDLYLYLHAWRYQGPNWKFETKLPFWVNEK